MTEVQNYNFVIIGGGIAGVSCAEMLSTLCEDEDILLITASELIKAAVNYKKVAHVMETFDVEEKPFLSVQNACHNVTVIQDFMTSLNSENHILTTANDKRIQYEKLCICTGGKPKVIARNNPYVLGIRDTESAQEFQKKLSSAKRIIIVGNGGIATELVYEVENCDVIWAIKDKSISHAFVDSGAATFFLPELNKEKLDDDKPVKRLKYTVAESSTKGKHGYVTGGALGPDWASNLHMAGTEQHSHNVHVEYEVEVQNIYMCDQLKELGITETPLTHLQTERHTDVSWPVYVELTNGKTYGCDFIVSATGVIPSTDQILEGNMFDVADDGGITVDDKMHTSVPDVFAAGDVCTASWDPAPHWLQMRLWTQARQMGAYVAKCMHADRNGQDMQLDICFEMFSHVTKFFNYKVVLLGKFNAQGLENDHELLLRVSKGEEYVKAVLKDNRLYGAVLIGETDLEETFENLILNQTDLTDFKDELLNPNIDIEDFFD